MVSAMKERMHDTRSDPDSLTQSDWGNWYGSYPYGDDPLDQQWIKRGRSSVLANNFIR